ncbi:MAG: S41 family peptidase [Elusimicrobia bacterium]|nr:S41 family peptidase [Elusimicrobiota bacterium]
MRIIAKGVMLVAALSAAAAPAWAVQSSTAPVSGGDDKVYEQLDLLVDVLDYIEAEYVDAPDVRQLVYGAAAGMARKLDLFSQFMEPQAHREIKAETEGQFGGIGIRMVMRDGWPTVLTPLPGTPAWRQGVLPEDRIVAIEGESAKDLQVADAMDILRGPPGTKVKLSIWRAPPGEAGAPAVEKNFEFSRENIKIESVQQRELGGKIGYLRIIEFSARTTDDFHAAMKALAKGGLDGLVLDLRHNPGGLLASAVEVASGFLGADQLVVYTQGRRPESRQEFRSGSGGPYPDLPLVVLVNEGSASGAEIIAGALQDHGRALVMGQRTFGKASVQSVIPLPDNSGLRLTIARYYTPNGRSIQRDPKHDTGGIAPDIEVPIAPEDDEKLFAQWEQVYEPGKKPRSAVKSEELIRDEALETALSLLKARGVLGRLQPRRP